jgi:glucokinase
MNEQGDSLPVLGIDVGGTKVAAGWLGHDGRVLGLEQIPTPPTADLIPALVALTRRFERGGLVQAIGIGVPGFLDADRNTLLHADNLHVLSPLALREPLQQAIGLPVELENDANLVALAEATLGGPSVRRDAVVLTLGTGVGGGIVIDGRIHRGRRGSGAELGHVRVVEGGRTCPCGQRGCLEAYVSGPAIIRDANESVYDRSDPPPWAGTNDGQVLAAAARAGDPCALAAFVRAAGHLARALATLDATLDPEVFVIGGGLWHAADLYLDETRVAFDRVATRLRGRELPRIELAVLGPSAGVAGAALLAAGAHGFGSSLVPPRPFGAGVL